MKTGASASFEAVPHGRHLCFVVHCQPLLAVTVGVRWSDESSVLCLF